MIQVRPKILAFNIAFLIALLNFFLFFLVDKTFHFEINHWLISSFSLITLLISYLLINYTFNRYHYSNVKLIYKNILQLKTNRANPIEKNLADEDVVPEINR